MLLVSSYQMGTIIDKLCGFNGLSLEMAYMVEGEMSLMGTELVSATSILLLAYPEE